jgi:hypothetical protein
MNAKNSIGLAELIERVRQELFITEDTQTIPLFSVDEIRLQIQVTVNKEGTAGVNIQVVELGGTVNREDVHQVEVTLTPLVSKEERIKLFKQNYPTYWKVIENTSLANIVNKGDDGTNISQKYGD